MAGRFRSILRALLARDRFENGMTEELRFHIETCADDLVRSGVPVEDARRRARVAFGSVDNVKRDCRDARGLHIFDVLAQDVAYALRLMRKTPAFTATALATIAICLGANLAIFAVVDSVLLRPLPFPQGERLVRVFNTYPKAGVPDDGVSLTNYYERRGHVRAFSSLSIHREAVAIVGEVGATEREPIARVSPEFFATLGVNPVVGRPFTEAETTFQTDGVAIVTDGYWRSALGGDAHVIGRRIRVDGLEKTIVGVLPGNFSFLSSKARLYFPLSSNPDQRGPDRRHSGSQADMLARLEPGRTIVEAQAEIDAHNAAMEKDSPEARDMAAAGFRSMVVPLHASHVAEVRPTLLLVQAGALLLLFIGTVNLANLLLIRAAGRVKEFAVRQAVGASRWHVVGEVMVETLVLTLAGGSLGILVGLAGIQLLESLGAEQLPLGTRIAFDARIALVSLAGAVLIGLAVGVPIAWNNLRAQSAGTLHSQSRTTTASRAAQRLRHGFLVAQVALAFVLLAGAGLLGLSLQRVASVSPGFRPENVLTAQVSLPWKTYQDGRARLAFTERLMAALGRQPGIMRAGIVTNVPLSGRSGKSAATVKGRALRPGEAPHGIYSYGVGGDYFGVMGFALREGRFLTAAEARREERVCVVDEAFARRNFPAGHALGQRLSMGGKEGPDAEAFTVVGVVGAVKQAALTEDGAQGAVFYVYPYFDNGGLFVVARTSLAPELLASTLQRVVRSVDGEVPVADVRSMQGRIEDSLLVRRSPALLAALFSGIALLLTAIGTYGVLSYAVVQRRREIGLRIALGARPDQVRSQFVRLAARLLGAGTLFGIGGAWMTGRAMQAVLFDVPPLHMATIVGTAAIMGIVALAACIVPSNRAARTSPIEVLAEE
jgi:predicted permease